MTDQNKIITPIGRMVAGNAYEGSAEGFGGVKRTYKTGDKAGQLRYEFFIGVAIPKKSETHWNQTPWGAKIWACGVAGFPTLKVETHPSFAWKITDGDSTAVDTQGNKICDREGYKGNWIVRFTNGFAPRLVTDGGLTEYTSLNDPNKDVFYPGCYVEALFTPESNNYLQKPGVHLNVEALNFVRHGDRIVIASKTDLTAVGFSPADKSAPKVNSGFAQNAATPPPPHTSILTPLAPKGRQMTPKAGSFTYEQLIANGWDDATLIREGMMTA